MVKSRKSKRLAAKRASEAADSFPTQESRDNNIQDKTDQTVSVGDIKENDKSNPETSNHVRSMTQDLSSFAISCSSETASSSLQEVPQDKMSDAFTPTKKEVIVIPPETEPAPSFQPLTQNEYLFERKKSRSRKDIRRMVCDCILTKEERHRGVIGCTDDCLNRMLMIECGSRCPLGDNCANKRFQKRQYARVEPFRAGPKGWGLRAMQRIPAGSFILEYVGEVVDSDMFRSRVKKYDRDGQIHHYFMALKSDEIIDATVKGNIGRFTNHSCEPNCETQKWTVNGELRVGFFAIQTIEPGEEVTLDYQFQRYGKEAQKCFCGAPSCRGYIGATEETTIDLDGSRMSKRERVRIASLDAADRALEAEIDNLVSTGFLKNKAQTMSLARLMVRADETSCRIKLLNVINNTQVPVFLRLFLDYHGLQLLWSWMVDAEDPILKAAILQVLSILPIPDRSVLKDSKVLEMVEKWAKEPDEPLKPQVPEESHPQSDDVSQTSIKEDETTNLNSQVSRVSQDSCSNSQSSMIDALAADEMMPDDSDFEKIPEDASLAVKTEEDASKSSSAMDTDKQELKTDTTESEVTKFEQPDKCIQEDSKSSSAVNEDKSQESASQSPSSEQETKPVEDEVLKELPSISSLAQKLLEQWKNLKEGFKIPRLIRQKRLDDEREANETHQQEVNRPRDCSSVIRGPNINISQSNDPTSSLLLRRKKLPTNPVPMIPPSYTQGPDIMFDGTNFMMNNMDPSLPPRVSKEQHRYQFELDVIKKQYEEEMERYKNQMAQIQEEMERQKRFVSSGIPLVTSDPFPSFPTTLLESGLSTPSESIVMTDTEYPGYDAYSSEYVQDANYVEDYEYEESEYCDPYFESLPELMSNQDNIVIECSPPENELNMTEDMVGALVDYGFEFVPVKRPAPSFELPDTLFDRNYPPPGIYFECIFDDTVYFAPQFISKDGRPGDFFGTEVSTRLPNISYLYEPVSGPLPRFWSRAKDEKTGRNYYFNKRSGKVQWSLPEGSGFVSKPKTHQEIQAEVRRETLESIVASADSTSTPPVPLAPSTSSPSNSQASPPGIFAIVNGHDKKPSASEADQSAKKKKAKGVVYDIRTKRGLEKFKEEVSEFVKKTLYAYRRSDCKLGRITSNEDFKFLARKLTNEVYQKETNSGKTELFVNETVKTKAKSYIKKYMASKGAIFKVTHSPSIASGHHHHSVGSTNSIFSHSEDHSLEEEDEEEHMEEEEEESLIANE